jgi:hypothetical protein
LLNGNITKYVPKKKHYCCTLSNKGRTYTAIGVESVGYVQYYERLFGALGIKKTPATTEHHADLDKNCVVKRAFKGQTDAK